MTTYEAAGVSIDAADAAIELMKEWTQKASRPEVVGGLGGFAGLFDASALKNYRRPLLATSTDGVGTKIAIAQAMDRHDTIGYDLVGMVLDDIVVCGAEPLFMTDYIATGKVVPERIAAIVSGIAQACAEAGCALVGGETAEHPGLLAPEEYDVAGAATGVVEADAMLGSHRVQAGDVVVALASSGLHANGYSLVRHVLFTRHKIALDLHVDDFGRTWGEELLEPTRLYTQPCLQMARIDGVHAFSHITGGGIAANIARVLPAGLSARLDRSSWQLPPIFGQVQQLGEIDLLELEKTLNCGIGMAAIVAPAAVDAVLQVAAEYELPAWVAGSVAAAATSDAAAEVTLEGVYRS